MNEDTSENVTVNPKSWIAWKREAEKAAARIAELEYKFETSSNDASRFFAECGALIKLRGEDHAQLNGNRARIAELEAGVHEHKHAADKYRDGLNEACADRDRFKAEAERLKGREAMAVEVLRNIGSLLNDPDCENPSFYSASIASHQRRIQQLESELATLRPRAECAKELSEALDILESYVDHSPNCRGEGSYMKGCDCGVNIARTASKEALAKYRALP